MKASQAFLAATAMMMVLIGCSFRGPSPQAGRIVTLEGGDSIAVGQPVGIRADVQFTGDVHVPTLAVVSMPVEGPIQVAAYAMPAQPWLGLGVFPVDRKSPRRLLVETTIVLNKAGTFSLQGLWGSSDEVTATASLTVH